MHMLPQNQNYDSHGIAHIYELPNSSIQDENRAKSALLTDLFTLRRASWKSSPDTGAEAAD